ncbi:Extracellular exo-alpha-(1-_5)-L-arabinofuranosidase precursor [Caloramator mitchellensis]|uniref:Extracellular exo-alpha-(1->5)-L-arabinofuranosidase n=1 Tax=Caloramator mitchellensis TaxID=908809 RepID=A0A0R3JZH0_CALMK|nr:glycoside hydrolase family 43 protein [Caloramator mitchellensis]KRQ87677.1 Extracellular exo-alpha-(1->5)-L-arabinofuranosidase precursor [Caloramator mitchellensis]
MKKSLILFFVAIIVTVFSYYNWSKQQSTNSDTISMDVNKYKNPVYVPDGASVINIADPTVIKYNGEYYLYGTSDIPGFNVFKSRDLVNWEYKGVAYLGPPANGIFEGVWNLDWFWAPAIYYDNGKFYMYYSAGDPSKGAESRNIGVAISDNPLGPFKDYEKNPIITDVNSIDGFVFKDEDGEKYFYYNQVGAGFNGIAVRHMKDMFSFDTEETRVISISEPWEGVINEGPVVLKRNGKYYLMFSGGDYADKTYAVGYATADRPMSDLGMADNVTWKKYDKNPIIKTTDKVISPGHHDLVLAPNNLAYYIIYHTKRYEEIGPQRQIAIDRLFFNYDKLFTFAPTSTEMPYPEKPDFQDWFDGDESYANENWRIVKGEFRVKNDELVSKSEEGFILNKKSYGNNYIYEVNMKVNEFKENSTAGFVASYIDANNYIKFYLKPSENNFVLEIIEGGNRKIIKSKISKYFNLKAYHQYILKKNGKRIEIYVDNIKYFEDECQLDNGSFGLCSKDIETAFDGIAFTSSFEDNFEADTGIFNGMQRQNGELILNKDYKAIFGDKIKNYEFGFDFKFENLGGHSFYSSYEDEENNVKVSIEGKKLKIEKLLNGKKEVKKYQINNLSYGDFNPTEYNSFRVVKYNDIFIYYINGNEIAIDRADLQESCVGFINQDSKILIDNVYLFGLNY